MAEVLPAVVAALVIGFLAGLLTFKRSLQWCRQCGQRLRCPMGHDQRVTSAI